jgi:hypothetical protein
MVGTHPPTQELFKSQDMQNRLLQEMPLLQSIKGFSDIAGRRLSESQVRTQMCTFEDKA